VGGALGYSGRTLIPESILADDQIVEITYFLVRRVVDCLAPEFSEAVAIATATTSTTTSATAANH
jgi:hypothetical protein